MQVTIKGLDIIQMIDGGKYNANKTVSVNNGKLNGIQGIEGKPPDSPWTVPNPFYIKMPGNKDLCVMYNAFWTDKVIPIPKKVKQLKVVCVGGGQGGQSASTVYQYKIEGSSATYRYAESGEATSSKHGNLRCFEIDVINGIDTFSIEIGKGSAGAVQPGYITTTRANLPFSGKAIKNDASPGGDTTFTYNNIRYTAEGGGTDLNSEKSTTINNMIEYNEDVSATSTIYDKFRPLGGKKGVQGTTNPEFTKFDKAKPGQDGYCRVYFLY